MKRLRLLLLAAACAPMVIYAQPARDAAVTDAAAAVPPPKYQSAYADYMRSEEATLTPDKQWIEANRQVSGQAEPEPRPAASVPGPATPASSGKPAKDMAADPHAGHHMNKKGQ